MEERKILVKWVAIIDYIDDDIIECTLNEVYPNKGGIKEICEIDRSELSDTVNKTLVLGKKCYYTMYEDGWDFEPIIFKPIDLTEMETKWKENEIIWD